MCQIHDNFSLHCPSSKINVYTNYNLHCQFQAQISHIFEITILVPTANSKQMMLPYKGAILEYY